MQATAKQRLTPEALWQMKRMGNVAIAPNGETAVYALTTYSKTQNNSHTALYLLSLADGTARCLTPDGAPSQREPAFIEGGRRIAYLMEHEGRSQLFSMRTDGTDVRCLSAEERDIEGFKFSPDGRHVILIEQVPTESSIAATPADLPKATGMVINDLMYKHWDQYVRTIPHPFVAGFDGNRVGTKRDLLEGEPYECPMLPFGGIEQLDWSPDSHQIAYTCRRKTGLDYAISTDSDIFLYDLETGTTRNLCKSADYHEPAANPLRSMEHQSINSAENLKENPGYDQNPLFSPDGRYLAWSSMPRAGYESDRARLCVFDLKKETKTYVTESLDSPVNEFIWAPNSHKLYLSAVWHGCVNLYETDLRGHLRPLTADTADYVLIAATPAGRLIAKRHSMSHPDDLNAITPNKKDFPAQQLTDVNADIFARYATGRVESRWVRTTDGKQELCWLILPPDFDPTRRYPALLYCEGGPQSPVSQFWSYRWNFQMMAANDYVIIAPNRRGLPGFGTEWLEAISGDYTGQCMKDLLAASDYLAAQPFIDPTRMGCVGASFGGFSVYWLAGHHEGRFKCFIAHDGIFNTQQQYLETEELWFANWDLGSAPWLKEGGKLQKAYADSPHLSADKWDAPILCIHGQKDFRIEYTQAEAAFAAARLRGVPAQMLLFPDENHWVLKPQNGILWQRTFFAWLDRWLKPTNKQE